MLTTPSFFLCVLPLWSEVVFVLIALFSEITRKNPSVAGESDTTRKPHLIFIPLDVFLRAGRV